MTRENKNPNASPFDIFAESHLDWSIHRCVYEAVKESHRRRSGPDKYVVTYE